MIAERTIITRGTITEVLATLERRGLVLLTVDRADQRRGPVSIAAAGIRMQPGKPDPSGFRRER